MTLRTARSGRRTSIGWALGTDQIVELLCVVGLFTI
jgi:hypothetical protein